MDFEALYREARGHGHTLSISLREFKVMIEAAFRGKLLEELRPTHEMLVDCIDILNIPGSCVVPRHTLCSRIYRKLGVPRNSTDIYRYQQAGVDFRTLPRPRQTPIVVSDIESIDDGPVTDDDEIPTVTPDQVQSQTAPQAEPQAEPRVAAPDAVGDTDGIAPTSEVRNVSALEEATAESAAQRKDALVMVHRAVLFLSDVSAVKELDELNHIGDMIRYSMAELAVIERKRRQLVEDDARETKQAKRSPIECPVCYESPNENNLPRVLKKCGHVVCTTCVRQIVDRQYNPSSNINTTFSCPMCRIDTDSMILRI